jgi:hypothetical protein
MEIDVLAWDRFKIVAGLNQYDSKFPTLPLLITGSLMTR